MAARERFVSSQINFHDVRVLLGLLIVVQGFETSRYLGVQHSADQRIATMRAAQLVSAVIYMLFIALATVLFQDGIGVKVDVTAIIRMTKPVAIVLPLLISVAAIGSQFSAAVADNSGAGGLIQEIVDHKLSVRYTYLLILLVTVALTWVTNVNAIIAYASCFTRLCAVLYASVCRRVLGRSTDEKSAETVPAASWFRRCCRQLSVGVCAGITVGVMSQISWLVCGDNSISSCNSSSTIFSKSSSGVSPSFIDPNSGPRGSTLRT